MPHAIIELSGNIEDWGQPAAITGAVHDALCRVEALPAAAIKTRAIRHEIFHVGPDSAAAGGFVTVMIRLRPGRSDAVLQDLAEKARAAVLASVTPVAGRELLVSVEVQLMDPVAAIQSKV